MIDFSRKNAEATTLLDHPPDGRHGLPLQGLEWRGKKFIESKKNANLET